MHVLIPRYPQHLASAAITEQNIMTFLTGQAGDGGFHDVTCLILLSQSQVSKGRKNPLMVICDVLVLKYGKNRE